MKLSFEYNNYKITYNVTYKKRPSIAITVDTNGEVNVVAPVGTSVRTVMDKVKGHGAFILHELTQLATTGEEHGKKETEEITQCMYLGKNYGVETVENIEATQTTVKLVRGKFVVEAKTFEPQTVRDALCLWYINKANIKAKERIKLFKEHFDEVTKEIKVNVLPSTLWEIEKDNMTLDVNTIIGPVCVLDAIIVQALCRFNKIENSKAKLIELVEDYEEVQAWLQSNKDKFLFY